MKVLDENKLKKMADYINGYIRTHNGDSPKFGEILEYMDMSKSIGYRYLTRLGERGIGASLFNEITKSAKENGAEKLFISAIPSKETVAFYFSQGCVDAAVVIEAFVDTKEDRYFEYTV